MAGQSQKFSRHFHRRARKQLHDRLAPDDPDYVPPPPLKPKEALIEKLVLFAFFLMVAAGMLGVAYFDRVPPQPSIR